MQKRWKSSILQLERDSIGLVGDTLCSSVWASYLGPFPRKYRITMATHVLSSCKDAGLNVSSNYDVIKSNVPINEVMIVNKL